MNIPAFPHSRTIFRLGNLTICRAVFAFLLLFSLPAVVQGQPEILAGPIINPANGHSYYLLSGANWWNSESDAVAMGGHLVTINDWAENNWIIDSTLLQHGTGVWIGLSDSSEDWSLKWISGEPFNFTHWVREQPSGAWLAVGSRVEAGVMILPRSNDYWSGRWDDVDASTVIRSVVELTETAVGIATAKPQVVNGFVVGVTVHFCGGGYTVAPSVLISGGEGSGATAIATVANGKVTSITVQKSGRGYTGTPTVTIAPPSYPPRLATATPEVINGFVVSATLTDKGSGYTNAPRVTITGGGGSGATAIASINYPYGEVTLITIQDAGSGYTGPTTITIAPPPLLPPRIARGTIAVVNGFVVEGTLTEGGFGYTSPPEVRLVGGGGSGASAVATVLDNIVNSIRIINPGIGYTSVPEVHFGHPTHPLRTGVRLTPGTGNAAGKVRLTIDVMPGMRYQLESSPNLNAWTPTGAIIETPEKTVSQEFDVNQVGQFFRIKQAP